LRRQQQPGMQPDETAGQREGVDLRVAHHEKLEFLPRRIASGREAVAQRVDVVADLGIVQIIGIAPDLDHDPLAETALVGQRNRRRRDIAEIGQGLRKHSRHAEQHGKQDGTQNHGAMINPATRGSQ